MAPRVGLEPSKILNSQEPAFCVYKYKTGIYPDFSIINIENKGFRVKSQ